MLEQYKIDSAYFESPRLFAKNRRKGSKMEWDDLRKFFLPPFSSHEQWLSFKVEEEGWPIELKEDSMLWGKLIDKLEDFEQKTKVQEEVYMRGVSSSSVGEYESRDRESSKDVDSCWQKYKLKLKKKGFSEENVDSIDEECEKTLKYLRLGDGEPHPPIKGLVIGHVQSGKTANMAGLMAMCADWQWNMFIVLTGSIENLRVQNQKRLIQDLRVDAQYTWRPIDKPKANIFYGDKTENLKFNERSKDRYLTVCLKNSSRLRDLIAWLKSDPEKLRQMQIILIDDEADQASINTGNLSNNERTKVNAALIDLVNLESRSMNYIAYTATPYACVLNEPPGEDSLYPRDFIRGLPINKSYFGPERIFGLEDSDVPRLDIIRKVDANDIVSIKEIHDGLKNPELPQSLIDSLAWFVCSAAARRAYGQSEPTSMLIHTSQRVHHHQNLYQSIRKLLTLPNFKEICRDTWVKETATFTLSDFNQQFPLYEENAADYPNFTEIEIYFDELLKEIGHISFSEDLPEYTKSIHLCIDNYRNNGLNEEDEHVRLLYPEEKLGFSPAFIVIGGATLSRGLTLDGLVSSYFLRTSKLGDSLMQMGRWFGYRRGYELLPRIWTTKNTIDQFRYLATAEANLREQLEIYELGGAGTSPDKFGPKIADWMPSNFLRMTARNKMQSAKFTDGDFSGINSETTAFSEDKDWLENNIVKTNTFLAHLVSVPYIARNKALIYKQIKFDSIKAYLKGMNFHANNKFFSSISTFIDWYDKVEGTYDDWNVIVSGLNGIAPIDEGNLTNNTWNVAKYYVKKINRTRRGKTDFVDGFSIGSLSDPEDRYVDIPNCTEEKGATEKTLVGLRKNAGLNKTPQLIIYRIDAKGVPDRMGKDRRELNTQEDIIGLVIRVPGVYDKYMARRLTVDMPDEAASVEEADIDDAGELN